MLTITKLIRLIHMDKMVESNLGQYGTGYEAVLLNPPWNYADPNRPKFVFADFV